MRNAGAGADTEPRVIRDMCRAGSFCGPTAGIARGFAQVNLVILPEAFADDFARFCALNPKPCPLLERTAPGDPEPKQLAPGADLRTDLPRYRVFRNGECLDRPLSIESVWRDDLVGFLIGCSFTFEWALLEAGLPVRHIEESQSPDHPHRDADQWSGHPRPDANQWSGRPCPDAMRNVPMYRTHIECKPAGPFAAPLVVSMRPMTPPQADQARRVTARCHRVHGPPIHVGDPSAIGIANIDRPDYGDAVTIHPDEVPVFWACGVTPMEAVIRAKPDLAITHEPGHMFVTDATDRSLMD